MRGRTEKLGKLVIGPPADTGGPRDAAAPPGGGWWVACALAVLLTAGLVAGWRSGWLPAQFTPRKLVLRGAELTTRDEVTAVVTAEAGDSYLHWWRAARAVKPGAARWLAALRAVPLGGRGMLLDVTERRPVLRVESAGAGYWLCADGSFEKARLEDHELELFTRIKRLPVVRLEGLALAELPRYSSDLQSMAAHCQASLAGQIKYIALNANGEFTLHEASGVEIRLGGPQQHEIKIAALPMSLRTVNPDRSRIAYLDGTGRVQGSQFVFGEIGKEEGE